MVQDQRLTVSVGVAGNKFVAKVASDLQKPDGLVIVEPGQEREFLAPLPIGRLWGVGAKTEILLGRLGIQKIGDLARMDRAGLIQQLGKSGEHLWRLSHGIDDRSVSPEEGFQSIGHETTFERDTGDRQVLHDTLLGLTEKVARRLRCHETRGRTITVKLRELDFSTATRRLTLPQPADTTEKIFPAAWKLLQSLFREGRLVRLIGVYASNLAAPEESAQLPLFDQVPEKDRQLAHALDSITRRYGDGAIKRAALVARRKRE
jgi:nucleotidyltransferase/DNA polymerase involved in DNA repair